MLTWCPDRHGDLYEWAGPGDRGRPIAMPGTRRPPLAAPENSQPFTEIARAALREPQASATTLGAETAPGLDPGSRPALGFPPAYFPGGP